MMELYDHVKIKSSGVIEEILAKGREKASYIASKKLSKIYRTIGLK